MRRSGTSPAGRRPRRAAIVVVGAVLLVLTGCSARTGAAATTVTGGNCGGSSSSSSKTPVKISVIADLSGPAATLIVHGKAVVAAATTAAHLANTSGGIDCAPVQMVVHDGAGSSSGVTLAVREAITDRPAAVTGFSISGYLAGSVPLINQSKLPWMSTSPTFQGVAGIPYFFSTQPANKVFGTSAAEALKREFGGSLAGKKIAFEATSNSATNDEILAALTAVVEADGGSVGPVFRDPPVFTDWSSQAANTVAANADAVASVSSDSTTLVVSQGLKTANFTGRHLSVLSTKDATFGKIDDPHFLSLRDVAYPTPGTPLGSAVQAAGASVDDANASFYFGQEFAAATALIETLRRCGAGCTTDRFAQAVDEVTPYTVPLNAVLGPLQFSSRVATMPLGVYRWDAATSRAAAVGSTL